MKGKTFTELTGEKPEDVLGNDWENEIEDLSDGSERLGLLHNIPPESTLKVLNSLQGKGLTKKQLKCGKDKIGHIFRLNIKDLEYYCNYCEKPMKQTNKKGMEKKYTGAGTHKIGEHEAVGFVTSTGTICAECREPIMTDAVKKPLQSSSRKEIAKQKNYQEFYGKGFDDGFEQGQGEAREELVEKIEKIKGMRIKLVGNSFYGQEQVLEDKIKFETAYNQALSDVLAILK